LSVIGAPASDAYTRPEGVFNQNQAERSFFSTTLFSLLFLLYISLKKDEVEGE